MKQGVKWKSFPPTTFEFRQQCLASEIKYMGESLASAARIMSEESSDEGSTSRIVELGRRNELAEDGTRHAIHES